MVKTTPRQHTIIYPVKLPTNYEYSWNGESEDKAFTTSHFKSSGEAIASEFNKLLAEYIMLMKNKKHI